MSHSSNTAGRALNRLLKEYRASRAPISVKFRELVPDLPYGDRLTHFIHPYPGKLLPHIPWLFLNSSLLAPQDSIILDPFCGSGTVLLEAILSGRQALGFDANPLACVIAKAKTTVLPSDAIRETLRTTLKKARSTRAWTIPSVVNITHWYHKRLIQPLSQLSHAISKIDCAAERVFFQVAFSQLVRRVSLADPHLSVPVRLRSDQYSTNHRLYEPTRQRLRQIRLADPYTLLRDLVAQNLQRVEALSEQLSESATANVGIADARALPLAGPKNEFDLIITSPPYAGSQKYIRSSSLGLGWLGLCRKEELRSLDRRMIGREWLKREEYEKLPTTNHAEADRFLRSAFKASPLRACVAATYLEEMKAAIKEMHRVTRTGGHIVLIIGNTSLSGKPFYAADYVADLASEHGLKVTLRLEDHIHSRGLMTKRNVTASIIASETVLVMEKL